jgi:hypothetical protein
MNAFIFYSENRGGFGRAGSPRPRACFEFCDEQLSKDFEPRLKKSKDSESRLKKKDSEQRLKKSKD